MYAIVVSKSSQPVPGAVGATENLAGLGADVATGSCAPVYLIDRGLSGLGQTGVCLSCLAGWILLVSGGAWLVGALGKRGKR